MTKAKTWFVNTFWKGYSLFERAFLLSMVALQIIVFCVHPDTPLSIIAGLFGVVSVVLCAKGKIVFYFIGFVQNFSYLALAWQNTFYGEVIENIFYIITMILGIFLWKKNEVKHEDGTADIMARKFTIPQWIISVILSVIATAAMGFWLDSIGSHQAYTDAATNILAIFAQFLMVFRYREQWVWWIVIDLLCIKMWFVAGNWSMVFMYIAWTANCIYGWKNWTKLNKQQSTAVKSK